MNFRSLKEEHSVMGYSVYFEELSNEFYAHFHLSILFLIILVVGFFISVYQAMVKKTGKIEWIFVFIVLPIFIMCSLGLLRKYLKDLAYVKNGKYLVGTGTAITDDSRKTKDLPGRCVGFQFDDGEVLTISLY